MQAGCQANLLAFLDAVHESKDLRVAKPLQVPGLLLEYLRHHVPSPGLVKLVSDLLLEQEHRHLLQHDASLYVDGKASDLKAKSFK